MPTDYAAVDAAADDAVAADDAAILAACDPHSGFCVLAVCAMMPLSTVSQ